jgi:phenylacetate-CoA ligase
MSRYFDALETRTPEERAASLAECLPRQIEHARARSSYYGRTLKDIDPQAVNSRAALATLPITRKSDLMELQKAEPPLGGLNATPVKELARVFMSPGPLYEPEGHGEDWYRFARGLYAAGFRRGELVHNTFAYHLTPAGRIAESGLHALDCVVFPAGVGNTEQQVRAIADLHPAGYIGTPSFLKILLEKGRELGLNMASLTKALVSGEALPPSLRGELLEMGVNVLQAYATAELGLIAYESEAKEGLIADEGVIVEIVRPGTGEPVPEGEVGEVVVTSFNADLPLVRFATGDLSAVMAGSSPCGRTNMRIKGWMGRADQTTKVKGMFVHPSQIADIAKRHPEIVKARLVVAGAVGKDAMTLRVELRDGPDETQAAAIADTMTAVTKLKGTVETTAPGTLPNDGKVISDERSYE